MDEVEALLRSCGAPDAGWSRLSYRQAFERDAGFDPHALRADQLRSRLQDRRVQEPEHPSNDELADRDFWLDLWMSHVVGPQLGRGAPTFGYDFPAPAADRRTSWRGKGGQYGER